ncbi:MAG: hypothetical protein IPJ78_12890 [Gemmatimonadetes bacterium]|jgi:Spy/CpxP family protein refolding chaperone|nr:hypothetical protein [Gemmatimonadota bacterium]MBP7549235.1 hypothetical protein [Gemmatimonadaceae bacterium]
MPVRFLRFALALALSAPALPAQQAAMSHDHQAKPALDAELAEHFKGIALTDAQIRQVTEIKAKQHKLMEELQRNPGGRDSVAVRAEVQKLMDGEHAQFMALLTPEQKRIFEQNMRAHHPAGARPTMEHGAGGHDMGKAPTKAPEPKKP